MDATNRIISSTLLAQWLLKQSPVKAKNRKKKLSIPVRGYALAEGLHNPSISIWGDMTTPTIDGAAESLKLELAKCLFLDKTYIFGKFSFLI